MVDAPVCYTKTTAGTDLDAVKAALDNAKELSLKDLAVASDGKYTVSVTSASATYHVVQVYSSYAEAAKILTSSSTVNAGWSNALEVGYYIVIGGSADASTTCDYYEAFLITE